MEDEAIDFIFFEEQEGIDFDGMDEEWEDDYYDLPND
jgi:hypothetical protein